MNNEQIEPKKFSNSRVRNEPKLDLYRAKNMLQSYADRPAYFLALEPRIMFDGSDMTAGVDAMDITAPSTVPENMTGDLSSAEKDQTASVGATSVPSSNSLVLSDHLYDSKNILDAQKSQLGSHARLSQILTNGGNISIQDSNAADTDATVSIVDTVSTTQPIIIFPSPDTPTHPGQVTVITSFSGVGSTTGIDHLTPSKSILDNADSEPKNFEVRKNFEPSYAELSAEVLTDNIYERENATSIYADENGEYSTVDAYFLLIGNGWIAEGNQDNGLKGARSLLLNYMSFDQDYPQDMIDSHMRGSENSNDDIIRHIGNDRTGELSISSNDEIFSYSPNQSRSGNHPAPNITHTDIHNIAFNSQPSMETESGSKAQFNNDSTIAYNLAQSCVNLDQFERNISTLQRTLFL